MSHLFISYSRGDSATVDALTARLEGEGQTVWIDRKGIDGGTQWRKEIVDAIETCGHFILVLSHRSVQSKNVRREVDLAETSDRRIVPVLIEPVTLPSDLRYQLSGIQMIELPDLTAASFGALTRALGAADPAPPEKARRREAVDLAGGDGGGFLGRLAKGKLFGR